MIAVVDNRELSALMQKVKERGGTLRTNFFIDPLRLSNYLKEGFIYYVNSEQGILLLRKDWDFYHLYYYTNSLESLKILISTYLPQVKLVTDIIGQDLLVMQTVEIFETVGFKSKKKLCRYVRMNNLNSNYYLKSNEVSLAVIEDAKQIGNLFIENFNKLFEQVPNLKDVENLIAQRKILVVKNKDTIKGFLVRTATGKTAVLNNFLVDKLYRQENIGTKLLQHYINESQDSKRMILWVIAENEVATNIYKKHGYFEDNLIDYILVNDLTS